MHVCIIYIYIYAHVNMHSAGIFPWSTCMDASIASCRNKITYLSTLSTQPHKYMYVFTSAHILCRHPWCTLAQALLRESHAGINSRGSAYSSRLRFWECSTMTGQNMSVCVCNHRCMCTQVLKCTHSSFHLMSSCHVYRDRKDSFCVSLCM